MRIRFVAAFALASTGIGLAWRGADAEPATKDVVATIGGHDQLATFSKLLAATDLAKTLAGKGPFTVFAPTDEAFAQLPEGELAALGKDAKKAKALLLEHVVAGKHDVADLGRASPKAMSGTPLAVEASDGVVVGGAKIVGAEIEASNGVVHMIDHVLRAGGSASAASDSLYAISTSTLEGKPRSLADFKGKVTLVVNVASECGFTPQYAGLEKLHTELVGKGFSVLGFPSNEFGGQEPGDAAKIRRFCESKYAVTFPMFAKVATKPGDAQSPVYAFLTKAHPAPSWNFCKYLVGKDGKVIAFYKSDVTPDDAGLRQAIESALK